MSVPDFSNVTLAYADPEVLSCWEGKVGEAGVRVQSNPPTQAG